MVREYCKEVPSEQAQDSSLFDETNVKKLLMAMLSGRGYILVDDEYRGFIAAFVTNNIWFPKILELNELAWWVKPEYRNGTLGGKLWIEFDRIANKLLKAKRVNVVRVSLTEKSPQINYEKRGYKKFESSFFKE